MGTGADRLVVQDHGYIVNLRLVWATYDLDSKKKKIKYSPLHQNKTHYKATVI